MNSELELDKRISVLEKSMEWAQGSIQNIHKNLDLIQNTQVQIIDKISEFKTENDQKFHEVNERITRFQAENKMEFASLRSDMKSEISSLRTETIERISDLQAHTDEKFLAIHARFVDVHEEFTDVHKEISSIHHAISVQTKWLLGVMIASATMISLLHPLAMTLLSK